MERLDVQRRSPHGDRPRPTLGERNQRRCHVPVAKFFTPAQAAWLITEVDPNEPDRLFGLCDLGQGCPELGYVLSYSICRLRQFVGISGSAFPGPEPRLSRGLQDGG
ncbi:DUF2958 domain-containing protein [Bradyrhizobium japonicum]|uniref:DUF2958 domain-containing protein n=1 Tax=Bradyrhizobium japonicum TaxID=375 RepID=UPI003F495527